MMQNHSHHLRCRADHHSSLSSSARSRQENRSANSFFQRPVRRGSLFILELGSASKGAANRDLLFLSQSWSRCPAEKWVPALLEGVWTRVSAAK